MTNNLTATRSAPITAGPAWSIRFGPDGDGLFVYQPDGTPWVRPDDVRDGMFSIVEHLCETHGITRDDISFPPLQLWKE